jgi:hypothetical protein
VAGQDRQLTAALIGVAIAPRTILQRDMPIVLSDETVAST